MRPAEALLRVPPDALGGLNMKQLTAKIVENKRIADNFYKMRIKSAYLGKNSEPGQFVEVRVSDEISPLLRRPLGVHRISKTGIGLLYEVVGKGTEILSRKKAGETLDVIGPLGTGFDVSRVAGRRGAKRGLPGGGRPCVLIAGGAGIAPLPALAERIKGSGREIIALIGARTGKQVFCESEFKELGAQVRVSTEDGSRGKKGLVTDMLKDLLSAEGGARHASIYACGPVGMLKEVARIAHDAGVKCQVSLEERMACGVGVCLGCPVRVRQRTDDKYRTTNYEYRMVCKDGPVFDAEEIAW
jgi:dihydroorotate dehydrogenase electron transfer subunit